MIVYIFFVFVNQVLISFFFNEGSAKDVVDIGELAALTVANESLDLNGSNASSTMSTEFRKTWNPKYILKYDIFLKANSISV